MACGEFSLIARYFDRVRSSRLDVELGIGDDCALLNIPEKQTLAISTDTLVAGNHFLPDIDPADLAYKALAVNLSDLAALPLNSLFMGHCAWPIRVSATFLMRKQGVAPTVVIARRRAVCHTH